MTELNFENALTFCQSCQSGYSLAKIGTSFEFDGTKRAIDAFTSGEDTEVYVSLQNKDGIKCKSKYNMKCNAKLQNGYGRTLADLNHLDLDIDEEMCILYDTEEQLFEEASCNEAGYVICEKDTEPHVEYWIDLYNSYEIKCDDGDCFDESLTNGDGDNISLANFGGIDLNKNQACVVAKDAEIKTKECNSNKLVVCELKCSSSNLSSTILPSMTTTTTTSATTTVTPTTPNSAPHLCQPSMSFQSPGTLKFYRSVASSNGYAHAPKLCSDVGMELANIGSSVDALQIQEILGSVHFLTLHIVKPLLNPSPFRLWQLLGVAVQPKLGIL
eukprot:TCALIF_12786-PA protein Name:"Protein of unknown function" AED:0.31 eAED:0.31 QI:0/0.5/0/1/0.5/0.66/3/0/328